MGAPSSADCTISPTCARATADDLPNELLLYIFPLLPLSSLIVARCVDRRWRSLMPAASLCPVRRKYLEFFTAVVRTPAFAEARQRVRPHLRTFDREAYLRVLARASAVPEEFVLWVREWPEQAVCTWVWPALDCGAARKESPLQRIPSGWSVPYIKCVTFRGGKSPFDGAVLHAIKILPIELSSLGVSLDSVGSDEDDDETENIEITVLCLRDGRVYVLDGKRGGEALVGIVYAIKGSYTMQREKIVAKSWLEFLEKDLEAVQEWLRPPHEAANALLAS